MFALKSHVACAKVAAVVLLALVCAACSDDGAGAAPDDGPIGSVDVGADDAEGADAALEDGGAEADATPPEDASADTRQDTTGDDTGDTAPDAADAPSSDDVEDASEPDDVGEDTTPQPDAAEDVAQDAQADAEDAVAADTADDAAEDAAEDVAEDAAEDVLADTAEDVVEDTAEDAAEDVTEAEDADAAADADEPDTDDPDVTEPDASDPDAGVEVPGELVAEVTVSPDLPVVVDVPLLRMEIPVGAVSATTQVRVVRLDAGVETPVAPLGEVFVFEPEGLTFNVPVTMELRFAERDNARRVVWGRYDAEANRVVEPEFVSATPSGANLRFQIEHFSVGYAGLGCQTLGRHCNQDYVVDCAIESDTMPDELCVGEGALPPGCYVASALVEVCVDGCGLVEGLPRCLGNICAPGEQECRDGVVFQCDPTGAAWVEQEDCGAEGVCVEDDATPTATCAPRVCEPLTWYCDATQRDRLYCNALGTGPSPESTQNCSDRGLSCEFRSAECFYNAPCTPNALGCIGNTSYRCSPNGIGGAVITECPGGCVDGICAGAECPPGEFRCRESNNALQECMFEGIWVTVEGCTRNVQACDLESRSCLDIVCDPGETRCMEDRAEQCNANGTGWAVLDTCEDGEICDDAQCHTRCPETLPACDGDTLVECLGDGYTLVFTECGDDAICDAATLTCQPLLCSPGSRRCVGMVVEECAPDGFAWSEVETCPDYGICHRGGCYGSDVPRPGPCLAGSDRAVAASQPWSPGDPRVFVGDTQLVVEYRYDASGRPIRRDQLSSTDANAQVFAYGWDGAGLDRYGFVDTIDAPFTDPITRFFYPGGGVLLEERGVMGGVVEPVGGSRYEVASDDPNRLDFILRTRNGIDSTEASYWADPALDFPRFWFTNPFVIRFDPRNIMLDAFQGPIVRFDDRDPARDPEYAFAYEYYENVYAWVDANTFTRVPHVWRRWRDLWRVDPVGYKVTYHLDDGGNLVLREQSPYDDPRTPENEDNGGVGYTWYDYACHAP